MRARLAAAGLLPYFWELGGLRPWDVGRLTSAELALYEANARALRAARIEAADRASR